VDQKCVEKRSTASYCLVGFVHTAAACSFAMLREECLPSEADLSLVHWQHGDLSLEGNVSGNSRAFPSVSGQAWDTFLDSVQKYTNEEEHTQTRPDIRAKILLTT
jgi:hypothetical protein